MNISGRFNRLSLLARCLFRVIFSGKADKLPALVSRIIVVPTGKLGDVVCTTPVLRAIRDHLPQAQIIVAGNSKLHRPLLAESGLVDEYVDLGPKGALKKIRDCRADAAVVTGPSYEAAATLCAAGIPLVVAPVVVGGFSPSVTRPYQILQRFIKTFPYRIDEYAPRERLRVLEPLGVFADDTKKKLGISAVAAAKAKKFFSDHQINPDKDFVVGISPSVGNEIKEWPEDRFAQVADHLINRYQAKIIMIGGPRDHARVKRTIDQSLFPEMLIENTDFDVAELKALIAGLHLFLAVDTGPIYIAEAFEVPTVDIVGPVDEKVQPPRGFIHRNVVPPNRPQSELTVLNARSYDREEALRQVLSITAAAVITTLDRLISDLGNKGKSML